MHGLRPRDQDRGQEDLLRDAGERDLRRDGAERDLREDPGTQDLVRDRGVGDTIRLGPLATDRSTRDLRSSISSARRGRWTVPIRRE